MFYAQCHTSLLATSSLGDGPGLVSRFAPVRPVARAIKIKHAGLNLTGPLWSNWSWTLCAARVRVKPGETYRQPQAASFKPHNL